jgi:hypothetical protein
MNMDGYIQRFCKICSSSSYYNMIVAVHIYYHNIPVVEDAVEQSAMLKSKIKNAMEGRSEMIRLKRRWHGERRRSPVCGSVL